MIVITGGAGFLGSSLAWHLNQAGRDNLLIVDSLGQGEKFRNLVGLRFHDYMEKDDFLTRIESGRGLPDIDAIMHLGACSATTESDASFLMCNNFSYTRSLANWCLARTPKVRLIYASSAATYGDGEFGYSDEPGSIPYLRPLNKYAFSKQTFDLWALAHGAFGSITGLKYFNVFGPNEYHKGGMRSMVLKAFEQICASGCVQLFRSHHPGYLDGEQERDFIYVKDAVRITAWFLDHPEATGIYNVGTGKARTWKDLAGAVFGAMDMAPKIEYIDMPENIRKGYQYSTQAEMRRLYEADCKLPAYSLEEAVRDYVQNYLQQDNRYLKV